MSSRCTSIRPEDLAKSLKTAVSIEQQRIENLSKSDVDSVAGGALNSVNTILTGSPTTNPGTTVGMYPTGDQLPGTSSTSSF